MSDSGVEALYIVCEVCMSARGYMFAVESERCKIRKRRLV